MTGWIALGIAVLLERVSNINDFDSWAPSRPDSKALAGIAGTWENDL